MSHKATGVKGGRAEQDGAGLRPNTDIPIRNMSQHRDLVESTCTGGPPCVIVLWVSTSKHKSALSG